MFGLIPWNPYQELMSWHRDIDELFNRVFPSSRPEQSSKALRYLGCPRLRPLTKTASTLCGSIFRASIPKTWRSL